MTKVIELPASQYVAVERYDGNIPVFNKEKIWASDQVAAGNLFALMGIPYVDVMVFEDTSKGRLYDDEE